MLLHDAYKGSPGGGGGPGEMGENANKSFLVVQYIPQERVSTVAS